MPKKNRHKPHSAGRSKGKKDVPASLETALMTQLTPLHLWDSTWEPTWDAASASSAADADEELQKRIVKQVEHYFSENNLPLDKYLLGQLETPPVGYVSLDVLSRFNKMNALTQDVDAVRRAVAERSRKLQLTVNGQYLRPLGASKLIDMVDTQAKLRSTVIVDNLEEGKELSVEMLRQVFEACGSIATIRIAKLNSGGGHHGKQAAARGTGHGFSGTGCSYHSMKPPAGWRFNTSSKTHVYVEFGGEEAAKKAVRTLDQSGGSWRASVGMRVRPVCVSTGKAVQPRSSKGDGTDGGHAPSSAAIPIRGARRSSSDRDGASLAMSAPQSTTPSMDMMADILRQPGTPPHASTARPSNSQAEEAAAADAAPSGSANQRAPGEAARGGRGSGRRGRYTKRQYAEWAAASPAGRAEAVRHFTAGGGAAAGAGHGAGAHHAVDRIRLAKRPDGTKGFSMGRGTAKAPL